MNRAELVRIVQAKANAAGKGYFNLEDSASILDAVLEGFSAALETEEKLTLRGFGTFNRREYESRVMKGLDGEDVTVPSYKTVTFKASGNLKDRINNRIG